MQVPVWLGELYKQLRQAQMQLLQQYTRLGYSVSQQQPVLLKHDLSGLCFRICFEQPVMFSRALAQPDRA